MKSSQPCSLWERKSLTSEKPAVDSSPRWYKPPPQSCDVANLIPIVNSRLSSTTFSSTFPSPPWRKCSRSQFASALIHSSSPKVDPLWFLQPLGVETGNVVAHNAGAVVSHGSGQSFGFDSFAPLVMKRSFEAGRGGYPLASAFKDMQAVDDVVCGRLGLAELPSVVSGTMSTYKEVRRRTALALRRPRLSSLMRRIVCPLSRLCQRATEPSTRAP